MTRGKIKKLPIFALMLGIGAALSNPVIASQTPTSAPMTNYIQNASTPEDHEYIASLFELQAVRAQSIADSYAEQFSCRHSQATALQRLGVRFPSVTAQRHCRKMLRDYTNEAEELRGLADYHRRVADHWRATYR